MHWSFDRTTQRWPRLLLLFCLLWAGPVLGQLVINEFLPDPLGSDSGQEFVELYNAGSETIDLDQVLLQFANGIDGAVWQTRWQGDGGQSIPPLSYFLIVDRNWLGPVQGQAEVWLGLQNGPDAIRLVRQEQVLDMVGYGPLTDPDLMETSAVALEPGLSLSRKPDGADSDNNSVDLVASEPTPGAPNFEAFAVSLLACIMEPAVLARVGASLQVTLELYNSGLNPLAATEIQLQVGQVQGYARWDLCPSGQSRTHTWWITPEESGVLSITMALAATGDQPRISLVVGRLQVGLGALFLNEVLGVPGQGQGEWIEVVAAETSTVSLSAYRLRDEDGSWRTLPDQILLPGQRLVLAQDPEALDIWQADNLAHGLTTTCPTSSLSTGATSLPGGWPTLNNTPPPDRIFADRVWLADTTGLVVDQVVLSQAGIMGLDPLPTNRSLERMDNCDPGPGSSNWSASTALSGSTPGCPNSVEVKSETTLSSLQVSPRCLDPAKGVTSVHLRFVLAEPAWGWEARIFDLWGALARDLGGDGFGPGPRDLLWDGRDDSGQLLPPGGYVVFLRTSGQAGQVLRREKALVVIGNDGRP